MKRGQLFSMMAIFMSALFIIIFSGLTHVALNKNVDVMELEISRFASLAESLDYFVHKSLDNSAYLFLHSSTIKLQKDCSSNSDCYYSDFIKTFNDCVAFGKSDSWNCLSDDQNIKNISYKAQLDNLTGMIENRYPDLTINVSETKTNVKQTGPYTFTLNAEVHLLLERPGYSWNRFFNFSREVSLVGMLDPALAALGINKTIEVYPVEGTLLTIASMHGKFDKIALVVNNSYYFRDNRSGLSITEMFEGTHLITSNADNHTFGITSVLPLSLVQDSTGLLLNRGNTSLLEQQFLAKFLFVGGNTLNRFNTDDFYGVNDDIIVDSGFFNRLGILTYLSVDGCCRDRNDTYDIDGACDINCG